MQTQIRLALLIVVVVGLLHRHADARVAFTHASFDQQVYLPLIATSAPVAVRALHGIVYRDGSAFVGEVINLTSSPVYSVTVEVRVYDVQDRLLDTVTGTTAFPATLPGQPNPFLTTKVTNPYGVAYPRREVSITGWSLTSSARYRALPVVAKHFCTDGSYPSCTPPDDNHYGYLNIEGEIRNDQAQAVRDVKVVVWAADDYIREYASTGLSTTTLAPGQSAIYKTSQIWFNVERPVQRFFDNYHVAAQGTIDQ